MIGGPFEYGERPRPLFEAQREAISEVVFVAGRALAGAALVAGIVVAAEIVDAAAVLSEIVEGRW